LGVTKLEEPPKSGEWGVVGEKKCRYDNVARMELSKGGGDRKIKEGQRR